MTDQHLINIILNSITSRLCQGMAHGKDLCSNRSKWKENLLHMSFIAIELQKTEEDNISKGHREERCLQQRALLEVGE